MTNKVVIVPADQTILEVGKTLKTNNVGSVIVVDSKQIKHAKGIITERDLVHKILAEGKDSTKIKASEIMSTPLQVVRPDTSIEDASKAMKENKIKKLPVVNQRNELIGILTESDIMKIFPAVVDLLEEKAAIE